MNTDKTTKNGNGWKTLALTVAGAVILILVSANGVLLQVSYTELKDSDVKLEKNDKSIEAKIDIMRANHSTKFSECEKELSGQAQRITKVETTVEVELRNIKELLSDIKKHMEKKSP